MEIPSPYYRTVHMYVLNPKAVTIGELYGEVHPASNEWHDGLLGVIIRHACAVMHHFGTICFLLKCMHEKQLLQGRLQPMIINGSSAMGQSMLYGLKI